MTSASLVSRTTIGQSALVTVEWVYVLDWQMQCCGDPFETGSVVEWTTGPIDRDYLASFFPSEIANRVTRCEEHHVSPPHSLELIRGRVQAIEAVFCSLERRDGAWVHTPIPGSGVLDTRTSADGWERENGLTFQGYIVALDVEVE